MRIDPRTAHERAIKANAASQLPESFIRRLAQARDKDLLTDADKAALAELAASVRSAEAAR